MAEKDWLTGARSFTGGVLVMNSSKNKSDGYERGKAKYKEIDRKPQKTPEDIKLREKLSKQVKHWQQKKDFTGDNHSRNAKGNR